MGRAPCCDKENVKRGPWSPEEDAKLKSFIEKYGTGGNWIALPHKAGLKRCGKSCRLRWLNYLRPNIKHGEFTDDEDKIICSLYANIGSRWSIIAGQLPGRTDNDIKNYWNTKLKKKLLAMLPSFQKRPFNYPLPPLIQSPPIYRSDLLFTTSYNNNDHHPSPSNLINLSSINTSIPTTSLVQDHITNNPNSLINSLISNNNNENPPCSYLGFQGEHQQNSCTPLMEYLQYYPAAAASDHVKEEACMLMFGSSSTDHSHEVVSSTTGSSSEGGSSCLTQISYNNGNKKDHHFQKQQYHQYQIKQEDHQFSHNIQGGSGDYQSQISFIMNYTDQKPKGYSTSSCSLKNNNDYETSNLPGSQVEEVKQLIGNSNSYLLMNDINDEYKTTHKDICYHY